MADKELQVLNRDQELALAIERGEITREEVESIWANTTDLSAQTPIEVRRAVLLMKQAGSFEKAWPIFYKEVMRQNSEIQAAFNRDESKFSHLVAGTETIVKTLQAVNPLAAKLDDMGRAILMLTEEVRELRKQVDEGMKPTITYDQIPEPTLAEAVQSMGSEVVDVDPDDEEGRAQQARKDSIGSAWAK